MSGIIGYIGNRPAAPILLEGLKRLEYQGYDSAGMATVEGGTIQAIKTGGTIRELETKLAPAPPPGFLGIAHTRWATHGQPSETNAHPHLDCRRKIAVVHNGIIENHIPLKRRLLEEGHVFSSATDTEVLAHLIERFYKQNLGEAVRQALRLCRGTYGIAVVAGDQPNSVVAARQGSPLVVGLGENEEYYVASEVAAIIPFTKRVIYPADGELVRLSRQGYTTLTLGNQWVEREVEEVALDIERFEKGDHPHHMIKEIMEQPEVLEKCLAGRLLSDEGTARLKGLNLSDAELRDIQRVIFLGAGGAASAAFAGKTMVEEIAGIPAEAILSSEFRHSRGLIPPKSLVVAVSQSGETADTIAAMREVARKGIKVYGICNSPGSTIARETDGGIFIHAGPEIAVTNTKTFTTAAAACALLALLLGRLRGMPLGEGRRLATHLQRIPEQIGSILERREEIRELARNYAQSRTILCLGRLMSLAAARHAAHLFGEAAQIHAQAFPPGEMKHGPLTLVDAETPSIVVVPRDSVYGKTISNIEEIRNRGGRVLAIATAGDPAIRRAASDTFFVPHTDELLTPLLTAIPLQLLAYEMGVVKGLDVDKPRYLAKTVTVE